MIVTENAEDFAAVDIGPVVLVRKGWWPNATLAPRLAAALDQWAATNPQPGFWPHWLKAELP